MSLTFHDMFCGAGGSTLGAHMAGATPLVGMNHWPIACESYEANHAHTGARSACVDVVTQDPRRYPPADLLLASPECFPAGTLVLTERGQVPIEDVVIGDRVLTHLGRWRPVVRTQSTPGQSTVVVRGHGHPAFEVTPNHRLWTIQAGNECVDRQWRRTYSRPGWQRVDELDLAAAGEHGPFVAGSSWATPRAFEALPVPEIPGTAHCEELWWIIGRWLGDGCYDRGGAVLVTAGHHEADELQATFDGGPLRWRRHSAKRTATVFATSGHEGLNAWLREHFGSGARHKAIPSWALGMAESDRQALLDGYLSADGHVSVNKTEATTVSPALALGVRHLAESLGHRTHIWLNERPNTLIEGRIVDSAPVWAVKWTTAPGRSRTHTDEHSAFAPVKAIAPGRQNVTVYNIEVDEDHSYVANGIVASNCTHHSYARGKPKDDASLFDPDGDIGAERSRATMWDVVRFAEAHDYRAVIVENVGAAVKWGLPRGKKLAHGSYGPLFIAWLQAMEALDYRWRVVHLNSMVCGVPQSRERIYVVFWKKSQRAPDLDIPALGWCPSCDKLVDGIQRWKKPGATTGTHGAGYNYHCPGCATIIALAVRPAAAAIDWSLTAVKIGDRARPLKDATIERIRRGLERLRERPNVVRLHDGLVVQVGANLFTRPGAAPRAWPLADPLPTVTGTPDRALVLPTTHHGEGQRSKRADIDPYPTVTGANRGELAVVVTCRGDAAGADRLATDIASDTLATITASGNHHGLVVSNMDGNVPRVAAAEVAGTITRRATHAVVVSNMAHNVPRRVDDEAMGTVTGGNKLGVLVTQRGNVWRDGGVNAPTLPGCEVADTISAQGNHHGLVIANYGSPGAREGKQGWARHADDDTLGTVTATDSHALFNYRRGQGVRHPDEPLDTLTQVENRALLGEVTEEEIADCTFRMLQPDELKLASGFPLSYMLHGNKRDQVGQVGNAVTAPAEAELVRRVIASLA